METQEAGAARGARGVEGLVLGLGWFSVGLGLLQLLAPRQVARAIGVSDDDRGRATLRARGARELATGAGILARPRSRALVRARIAGYALDLLLLASTLRSRRKGAARTVVTLGAVFGVTLVDVIAARRLAARRPSLELPEERRPELHVVKAITIQRPRREVYRFWRSPLSLPRFVESIESVEILDERRSRWRVRTPARRALEWEVEIVEERPEERIAWNTLEHAGVPHEGTMRFLNAPGGRGTEVHVELCYTPPLGRAGAAVARLLRRGPDEKVRTGFRRLKQLLETGQVVHSEATKRPGLFPARPTKEA